MKSKGGIHMNYIILIPFKVPSDSLVEFNLKFTGKICKTYDELYDKVLDIVYHRQRAIRADKVHRWIATMHDLGNDLPK